MVLEEGFSSYGGEVFSYISDEVRVMEGEGLLRELPPFFTRYDVSRGTIFFSGREKDVCIFSSNDYLGMTRERGVLDEIKRVLEEMGAGAGASRLVTGNFRYHVEFEDFIRDFFSLSEKGKDVLISNSGWCANVGVISALGGTDAEIFSDELNHASIIDGCRLSRAKVRVFRHSDMNHLEDLLKSSKAKFKLIVVDSLFSMDGDFSPLRDISFLAERYSACLYVDEAHAFGIFGERGKGACDMFHVEPHIQLFTLSKAIGCYGAFIIAQKDIIKFIRSRARSFIFSTAIPPYIPAGARKSIEIMSKDERRRTKVIENSSYLRNKLKEVGLYGHVERVYSIYGIKNERVSQITPFVIGEPKKALEVSRKLFERGFFVQAIRPPSVPRGTSRLRITVTAKHTKEEIDAFVSSLKEVMSEID